MKENILIVALILIISGGIIGGYYYPQIIPEPPMQMLGRTASKHSAMSMIGDITMNGNNVYGIGTATTTNLYIKNGNFRLYNSNGDYTQLLATSTSFTDYSLYFPADDGDSGEFLKTDGSGKLDWGSVTMTGEYISTASATSSSPIDGFITALPSGAKKAVLYMHCSHQSTTDINAIAQTTLYSEGNTSDTIELVTSSALNRGTCNYSNTFNDGGYFKSECTELNEGDCKYAEWKVYFYK